MLPFVFLFALEKASCICWRSVCALMILHSGNRESEHELPTAPCSIFHLIPAPGISILTRRPPDRLLTGHTLLNWDFLGLLSSVNVPPSQGTCTAFGKKQENHHGGYSTCVPHYHSDASKLEWSRKRLMPTQAIPPQEINSSPFN